MKKNLKNKASGVIKYNLRVCFIWLSLAMVLSAVRLLMEFV